MKFTVKIAKVNIGIDSIYNDVFDLCKDYISDEKSDFCIKITPEDIEYEREKSKREAAVERRAYQDFKDGYLETLAVYRKIAVGLLDYGSVLMHGAVVGLNGQAYMFTAPSGVGKTTHTSFWLKTFPETFILNGDKPLLLFENGKVFACGTPWAGKEGRNKNIILPLKGICVLARGKENIIKPVEFKDIYPIIFQQIYRPTDEKSLLKTMEYIKRLGENTKFYFMRCNLCESAANVAFEGMNK